MDEINEDEVFEKKEKKKINFNFLKNKKFKIFLCICICLVIVAVLAFLEIKNGTFSALINRKSSATAGNIYNCGYANERGNYIYFVAPGEDMQNTNIYRTKKDSAETELIFKGNYDIRALNIYGNKMYFIAISYDQTKNENQEDVIDNKIYSMNLDGSNLKVINDNEFSEDENFVMYVENGKVYYVGTDENVYKMNLDGSNRELVLESQNSYLTMNEEYIIYTKVDEESSKYSTYIMNLKTNEERAITNSEILTPQIYADYIYYTTEKGNLARVSLSGGDEEIFYDGTAYNLNISDGYAYYFTYKDEENEDYTICINRKNLEGGDPEELKEMEYYSSFLIVLGEKIYYMDMNDEKAYTTLLNSSDKTEKVVKEWNYSDMHSNENNAENGVDFDETSAEGSEETNIISNETK